ncbi:ATP-binding protein [Panacagrimonas sp.]|uniref:hybrid sensor histidine kinase/response regulator n=1 Tax=Panacagrimonas sp. TaxID=2480088 RepID=UPI003B530140
MNAPSGDPLPFSEQPLQRIMKVRRDYNTWVADETMEDYALRFTARSSRKWSEFRVANTAFGAISFLALEALGAAVMVSYGFTNAFWAIVAVSIVIFLTGLPISWYAAKYGVDMDLLTRGAGFGYIGSTITSLIYATFTFIFFALEVTIMAQALKFCFGLPLLWGHLISALVIIPMVTHGITFISRFQAWTQPIWLTLMFLPFGFIFAMEPEMVSQLPSFAGFSGEGGTFNLLMFGTVCSVLLAMVAQIGEQIDFLRFMPEAKRANRVRWVTGLLMAGPGWIGLGALKMLGGALLAFVAIQHQIAPEKALEPTEMYRVGFSYVFDSAPMVLVVTAVFVVLSQLKINVTNAYAGSLAWSNFFARLTHSHPGRVVWLVFNVLIALALVALDVFYLLEDVLGLYSNVAISWVGALVADLVINKPLGLSPKGIEFKRAHLYDVNPVGVGAMLIASVLSIMAFSGAFGELAQAFSAFIALVTALLCAPLIAWATGGRFYIARQPVPTRERTRRCCICEKTYESEDMAMCPAYRGPICSLCCTLDARCNDLCKPHATLAHQTESALRWLLPRPLSAHMNTRLGHYTLLLLCVGGTLATIFALMYGQELSGLPGADPAIRSSLLDMSIKTFVAVLVAGGIVCWWLVLTAESRRVAQEESNRQTRLLMKEIEAHRQTDQALQDAKRVAERANQAKSRYITGVSHELRTPLNSMLGYAQVLERGESIPWAQRRQALSVIRLSGEHLVSLVDGLLDIASIESGKLKLDVSEVHLPEFLANLVEMFQPQARDKKIRLVFESISKAPAVVRADQQRLGQILINLLGNAVKFTDQGEVMLRLDYRREIATFEVRDSGIGLSAEDLQRVFQPFERGTNVCGAGGTGLGLTIAKLMTELMGGELTASSEAGRGSVFRVRLFLPEVRSPKPRVREPRLDVGGFAGPPRRVLIVDNERTDRQFLMSLLSPLGFELAEAASGVDAIRIAALFAPHLILLDLNMPGIDGWETARLLRRNGVSQAPVIVISADAGGRDGGGDLGPVPFMVKPVDVGALLACIGQTLDLRWTGSDTCSNASDAATESQASIAVAAMTLPPAAELERLRELGRLGCVDDILRRLDRIEREDGRFIAFTHLLRRHVEAFRPAEFLRALEEVVDHAGTPV